MVIVGKMAIIFLFLSLRLPLRGRVMEVRVVEQILVVFLIPMRVPLVLKLR